MILSNLWRDDLGAYPEEIRKVLLWLRQTDVLALPAGRNELDGERAYVQAQDVKTRPIEGSHAEAHSEHLDLMYWPEAGECIGVATLTGREKVIEPRPQGEDIYFLESVENERFIQTAPGDFLVLFPWDAHRPALHPATGPAAFRKIVVKIAKDAI